MKHKDIRLDVKEVTAEGTFEGLLAVYNNIDLGSDLIEPGAFTKTIAERGDEVPLLWQHHTNEPIGMLYLEDTPEALKVRGELVLDVPRAKEAHSLMTRRVLRGLSIGYDVVKSVMEGPVRRLKELRLWEGSLVTFPMNEAAVVTNAKELAQAIQELKAGRRLSAETMSALQDAISDGETAVAKLRALLEAVEPSAGKGAAHQRREPAISHSFLTALKSDLRGELNAN